MLKKTAVDMANSATTITKETGSNMTFEVYSVTLDGARRNRVRFNSKTTHIVPISTTC